MAENSGHCSLSDQVIEVSHLKSCTCCLRVPAILDLIKSQITREKCVFPDWLAVVSENCCLTGWRYNFPVCVALFIVSLQLGK